MKAIIVGGGKVGYYLLKTLKEKGYNATLIEKERKICDKIASEIEADIICGDGSQIEVLEDAGIERAEIVAAVTGKDEENLIICQMAKMNFNINRTIARINNPKNRSIFKALGVDKTVCSTEVIANLIEGLFEKGRLRIIDAIDKGELVIAEAAINSKSKWCNRVINALSIPDECIIALIIRNDKALFPKGSIEIKDGDKLVIITNHDKVAEIERQIFGE